MRQQFMKKIMIAVIMISLFGFAQSDSFVKNDWFVDEVNQPVKCIIEVTDNGLMHMNTVTKYNEKGFKESTVVTVQHGQSEHRKFFIYYQPYQGNERTVLASSELNRQELLASWHNIDATTEKWTSHLSYEVLDGGTTSVKALGKHGEVKELLRMFEIDDGVKSYSTEFTYFDSFEDYQLSILGKDVTAIVTLSYDEKGNWVYRKSMRKDENAMVKRFIKYYDNWN